MAWAGLGDFALCALIVLLARSLGNFASVVWRLGFLAREFGAGLRGCEGKGERMRVNGLLPGIAWGFRLAAGLFFLAARVRAWGGRWGSRKNAAAFGNSVKRSALGGWLAFKRSFSARTSRSIRVKRTVLRCVCDWGRTLGLRWARRYQIGFYRRVLTLLFCASGRGTASLHAVSQRQMVASPGTGGDRMRFEHGDWDWKSPQWGWRFPLNAFLCRAGAERYCFHVGRARSGRVVRPGAAGRFDTQESIAQHVRSLLVRSIGRGFREVFSWCLTMRLNGRARKIRARVWWMTTNSQSRDARYAWILL